MSRCFVQYDDICLSNMICMFHGDIERHGTSLPTETFLTILDITLYTGYLRSLGQYLRVACMSFMLEVLYLAKSCRLALSKKLRPNPRRRRTNFIRSRDTSRFLFFILSRYNSISKVLFYEHSLYSKHYYYI